MSADRVGVLEFADVTAIALSTSRGPSIGNPPTSSTADVGHLTALREHFQQALQSHSAPVVVDPHSMSICEQELLHCIQKSIQGIAVVDSGLATPAFWDKLQWQAHQAEGEVAAQPGGLSPNCSLTLSPTDIASKVEIMDNGAFTTGPAAHSTSALWCVDRRAQLGAVLLCAQELAAAGEGTASAVICRSLDDARLIFGALQSELGTSSGCELVSLFPRSISEDGCVLQVVASLQLALTAEPTQAARTLLEHFGLTPLEARNLAISIDSAAKESHLPWTLAAHRITHGSDQAASQPPHIQEALECMTQLLIGIAGLPASTAAFEAHALLFPGAQPSAAAEELFGLVQSMEANGTGRARSTDWGKSADALHTLVHSLSQRNGALDMFVTEHHRPTLASDAHREMDKPRLFVGTARSALSAGIDFDNIVYLDASARHLPGSQPSFPLGTAPVQGLAFGTRWTPLASVSQAAQDVENNSQLKEPTVSDTTAEVATSDTALDWKTRQGMFLDSLRVLSRGSLLFLCPAYTAAGLSELHGVSEDISLEASPSRLQRMSPFITSHFNMEKLPLSKPASPAAGSSSVQHAGVPALAVQTASKQTSKSKPMEMPYVSMSRVNEVSACGHKYVLGHVWGVTTDQPPVVKYGKALHHAAAILGEMFQSHAMESAEARLAQVQFDHLQSMQSALEGVARDLVGRFPSMVARQTERTEAQLIATELQSTHGNLLSAPSAMLYSRLRDVAFSQWELDSNDGGDARRLHSEMSSAIIHMVHAFQHELGYLHRPDSTLLSFPLGVELPISAALEDCLHSCDVEPGTNGLPLHLLGVMDRLDVIFPIKHVSQSDPVLCITDFKCAQQWRGPSIVPKARPLPIAATSRHQLNAYSKLVRCKLNLDASQPIYARVASLERITALGVQGSALLAAARGRNGRFASQDQVLWRTNNDDTGVDDEIIQAVKSVQEGHLQPEPSSFKCAVCRFQHMCSHSLA